MNSNIFTPINLMEEKKKFFFDPLYNPQFIYQEKVPDTVLYKYGPFGGEYTQVAKDICDTVIKKWGSETSYLDEVEGKVMNQESTTVAIKDYLRDYGLEDKVTLQFSRNFIPRTAIDGYKMKIRLPIEYRDKAIGGVLHHEIGTHVFRRINDEKQPWHEKRSVYGLHSHRETEEGLATLHSYIEKGEKHLWYTALQYYACSLAPNSSFSQIFEELKKYMDDRERRWNITLRAKRGMDDTSKGGGYTKDKVYLRGVVGVGRWLQANNFDIEKLYIGKVSCDDALLLSGTAIHEGLVIPHFYSNNPEQYKKRVIEILKINNLL